MVALATGYRADLEDHASLAARQTMFAPGDVDESQFPEEIDHRPWLKVLMQANMGSCGGHAMVSGGRICNYIASGGEVVELSRMFSYLVGQMECGLLGSDNGVTIDGVTRGAGKYGMPKEETFPYPNPVVYDTHIPQAAFDEGILHPAKTHAVLNGYSPVYHWLGAGLGAVIIGIDWVESLINTNGVVDELDGGSEGGHALCLAGYSKRRARDGRKYLWMINSHSTRWGNMGWAEINPVVVDQWVRQRAAMIGVSDMTSYGQRSIPTYVGMTG